MTEERSPEPVKLIVAALCSSPGALERGIEGLQARRGDIDHQGPPRPFDLSAYYEEEMGTGLQRSILSFDRLASPGELVDFKHECVELERSLAGASGRRANLDAGYLDHSKLVLASLKPAGQKIYRPLEWTFPDISAGLYDRELGEIRARYLEQLQG
jgi:hypothetical protein